MIKQLLKAVGVIALTLSASAAMAQEWVAGQHYQIIQTPVPTTDSSKIEVVEAFSYLCPHCNNFEPLVHAWEQDLPDDVQFERVPAVFSKSWDPMARAYYVEQLLDVTDKVHQPLFDAVHIQRMRFKGGEDLADLFANYGVDKAQFMKEYNSFAVNMKLKQGESRLRGYRIEGVPSMIVNGKYLVSATLAGSHENMLEVVDYLIDKERN